MVKHTRFLLCLIVAPHSYLLMSKHLPMNEIFKDFAGKPLCQTCMLRLLKC
jgi:hypothetical protein